MTRPGISEVTANCYSPTFIGQLGLDHVSTTLGLRMQRASGSLAQWLKQMNPAGTNNFRERQ